MSPERCPPCEPAMPTQTTMVKNGTGRAYPKVQPVRILAGALGHGMPQRDLLVSRQHRMLVSSAICERMFGLEQVLVSAIKTDVFARNFCRS